MQQNKITSKAASSSQSQQQVKKTTPTPHQTQTQQVQKSNQPQKQAQQVQKQGQVQVKQGQNAHQKQEASKGSTSLQQKQIVQQIPLKFHRTIQLTSLLKTLAEDKSDDKITVLIDFQGNAKTFFTYQGILIDISENLIKEALGPFRDINTEKARNLIITALRNGKSLGINADKNTNLKEYFKNCAFYQPKILYSYQKLFDEDCEMKFLFTLDEMNTAYKTFVVNQGFNFAIVYNTNEEETLEQIVKNLGLENQVAQLRFTKVVEKLIEDDQF